MNWWKELKGIFARKEPVSEDKLLLLEELRQAKFEWATAQQKFNYVSEKDQIDYAIYALEAAEKRYEMLIRSAKKMNLNVMDQQTGEVLEV